MASSNLRQRNYLAPPSSSDTDSDSSAAAAQLAKVERRKKRKRDANVYDAVAGRVTTTRALDDGSDSETYFQRRHRSTLRDPTLAPEEVLFQRARAPIRYAEKDIYNAHERLPDGGREVLPDSDMLKAVHGYAAHFYSALAGSSVVRRGDKTSDVSGGAQRNRSMDEGSMDETALVAFGILLEEAARDVLGKKGDLVFTEGIDVNDKGGSTGLAESQAVGFLDIIEAGTNSRRGRPRS
ncbi:hypothetical protein G7054_g8046 [Neopestalotiopsis clavispora]|nr:hypothetical protein G7054_g8046 [Neopestalotiopsis clavispora]